MSIQTVSNACASVALLNIVNNIPEIDLGEPLRQFKDFTATFTPALRGDAIGNFHFIKQVHNSFARSVLSCNASDGSPVARYSIRPTAATYMTYDIFLGITKKSILYSILTGCVRIC